MSAAGIRQIDPFHGQNIPSCGRRESSQRRPPARADDESRCVPRNEAAALQKTVFEKNNRQHGLARSCHQTLINEGRGAAPRKQNRWPALADFAQHARLLHQPCKGRRRSLAHIGVDPLQAITRRALGIRDPRRRSRCAPRTVDRPADTGRGSIGHQCEAGAHDAKLDLRSTPAAGGGLGRHRDRPQRPAQGADRSQKLG